LLQLLEKTRVLEGMRIAVIFLLMSCVSVFTAPAQEVYNGCNKALEICPNASYSLNNLGATTFACVNCEDDFNFCFSPENTIWCSFTTNATGGAVQIDFTNLVFETNPGQDNELQATIIEAGVPCDASSYIQIGNCLSNEAGNFSLNAPALDPNSTYYLVIDGDNNGAGITSAAECTFDLVLSGAGIDRPVPVATITASNLSACLNEVVSFVCNLTDCPDTSNFLWYVNGVLSATTTDAVFQTSELVDGDIVSVETDCYTLCPATVQATSQVIGVYTVAVDAGNDVTVAPETTFFLNGTTTAPVFYWGPTNLVSIPNILNPSVTPAEETTYSFTVEENGCILTDYVTAFMISSIEIPNTFSPNGDNINDNWVIKGIELYPNNLVSIFTRWGQKIYQTSSYSSNKRWDGTSNSGDAIEGVYYYVIDLNDGSDVVLKGTLTVLR
jgi:gliding motility-associated-like protein